MAPEVTVSVDGDSFWVCTGLRACMVSHFGYALGEEHACSTILGMHWTGRGHAWSLVLGMS